MEFLWGNTEQAHIERVQNYGLRLFLRKLPLTSSNYALRLILQKLPLTSSDLLRQTLGWTTLEARRLNVLLCQVHRCVTNQAPSYLCSKFTSNSSLSSKFTSNSSLHYAEARSSGKLHLSNLRTKFYHTSFEFQGAKILNELTKNTRDLKKKLFRDAARSSFSFVTRTILSFSNYSYLLVDVFNCFIVQNQIFVCFDPGPI